MADSEEKENEPVLERRKKSQKQENTGLGLKDMVQMVANLGQKLEILDGEKGKASGCK